MKRRDFLGFIAPAAIGALMVPELLIPKRTFFLPPAGGWHSQVWAVRFPIRERALELLKHDEFARQMLRQIADNMGIGYAALVDGTHGPIPIYSKPDPYLPSHHSDRAASQILSVNRLTVRGNSG